MDQAIDQIVFTYVIPVYNGSATLFDCLNSIEVRSDADCIVINDGSSEDEAEKIHKIVNGFSFCRLLNLECNEGISTALNTGISAARGQFIVRLDADDEDLPNRITSQHRFLLDNNLDFLGGQAELMSSERQPLNLKTQKPRKLFNLYSHFTTPCVHPTMMFKKEVFKQVFYRPSCDGIEDYVLIRELLKNGYNGANINSTLIKYRVSNDSQKKMNHGRQRLFVKHQFGINIRSDTLVALAYYTRSMCAKLILRAGNFVS